MNTRQLFKLFDYAAIVDQLQAGDAVLFARLSMMEWRIMSDYMPLQIESGKVYAAVLSAPDFEMSELEASATQEQENDFEDTQESIGRLRI